MAVMPILGVVLLVALGLPWGRSVQRAAGASPEAEVTVQTRRLGPGPRRDTDRRVPGRVPG